LKPVQSKLAARWKTAALLAYASKGLPRGKTNALLAYAPMGHPKEEF
jgi:hypothetical protein